VTNFDADLRDISLGLVIPGALAQNFPELMEWVGQAVNLELNKKVIGLAYKNLRAVVKGKVVNGLSYNLEVDLK